MILLRNDRAGGDHPVRDPCVVKSERQVVCSSLRAPNNAITDLGVDLSGSLALNALPPRGIMGMGPSA